MGGALAWRKQVDARYRAALEGFPGIRCWCAAERRSLIQLRLLSPILVQPEYPLDRDAALYRKFRDNDIYVRRYFYPLISDFPMYRGLPSAAHDNLPVARRDFAAGAVPADSPGPHRRTGRPDLIAAAAGLNSTQQRFSADRRRHALRRRAQER